MPIEITMPRLSDTMESGTVIKWNVKEGEEVSSGQAVADIETDKATMEMQVYDDGTMAKILVPEGKNVPVGTVIAVLAGEDEDVSEAASGAAKEPAKRAKTGATEEAEAESEQHAAAESHEVETAQLATAASESKVSGRSAAAPSKPPSDGEKNGRLRVSPVARRLADEHGVDVRSLNGSGPHGRVTLKRVHGRLKF